MRKPRVILTCKQVSRTLLEDHFDALPWHRKLAVRFHLSWCWICGKFNQQVIEMQHGIDELLADEDQDAVPPELSLPEDCRDRLLKTIHRDDQSR